MPIKMNYSFKKGCGKVSQENYSLIQNELMNFLGCKTSQYYYRKRKCFPNIPVHIKTGIEEIFKKYGITDPNDIWTITPAKNETGQAD